MQVASQTLTLYDKEANAVIYASSTSFPDGLSELRKGRQ